MEESNKAVEGEQPDSHQNELKKETTDSHLNKKPVVRKARSKAPETSGTRATSKTSAASPTRRSSNASSAQKKESNKAQGEIRAGKNTTATKAVPLASTTKAVESEQPNVISVPFREQKQAPERIDQKGSKNDQIKGNKKSTADHRMETDTSATLPMEAERDSDQLKEQEDSGKDLQTLKQKAEKAEKKVAKLKKKLKKAKRKDVKKNKLKDLKDRLIKAMAKLKRRYKKLKKATE